MTLPTRRISYLLVLAVFASSFFGLSGIQVEPMDAGAHVECRVGAHEPHQTVVGDCGKGCESCVIRERTCDLGNYPLDSTHALSRQRGHSPGATPSSLGASTSASVAFISTIRIQV